MTQRLLAQTWPLGQSLLLVQLWPLVPVEPLVLLVAALVPVVPVVTLVPVLPVDPREVPFVEEFVDVVVEPVDVVVPLEPVLFEPMTLVVPVPFELVDVVVLDVVPLLLVPIAVEPVPASHLPLRHLSPDAQSVSLLHEPPTLVLDEPHPAANNPNITPKPRYANGRIDIVPPDSGRFATGCEIRC